MKAVVSGQWSVVRLCCLLLSVSLLACSVPNLEEPECIDARDGVKQFYAWYIATEAEQRGKDSELFRKFVAPLDGEPANRETDRFVLTNDFPKAMRVGECKVLEPGKRVAFEVLLFWKDDVRSEQRSIQVESENRDGKWLIRSVTN